VQYIFVYVDKNGVFAEGKNKQARITAGLAGGDGI
jgi:hypothetical protein